MTRRTTAQDVVEDYTTVDVIEPSIYRASRPAANTRTHPPTTRRGGTMQAAQQPAGRPRPHTDEDVQILPEYRNPRQPVQPVPVRPEPSGINISISRRTLLRAAGGVLSVIIGARGLMALGSFARSEWEQINREIDEGQNPSTQLLLVCGHNDSPEHPTLLHAYVRADRRIQFEESNTQDTKMVRYFVGDERIPADVPLNQVNLKIEAKEQKGGKYAITLHVKYGGVGPFTSVTPIDYMFVDSGEGYFVGVQPKKK
jgi:hypothetical protein